MPRLTEDERQRRIRQRQTEAHDALPMNTYSLMCSSTNSDGVHAKMTLKVDAKTLEEATDILRGSLPGADWKQWVSTWGVTDITPRVDGPVVVD